MTNDSPRNRAGRRMGLLVGMAASSTFLLSAGCSSPGTPESASSATAQAVGSGGLVISGVYGGGGNANATFTNDFIEIFNRGTTGVSLGGMSLQYASFNGDFGSPVALPNVTIAPGKYFLVQGNSAGAVGVALPAPDLTATTNLSATNGKMALASVATALACGGATRCNSANIVDMVGYGTATDYEGPTGSAVGVLSATAGAYRKALGCTDTDVNSADFSVVTPVTAPRNQATTAAPCGGGTDAGVDADDGATATDSAVADTGPGGPGGGTGIVLSQVFGGGGAARGFVEIFNRTKGEISTLGLSLQIAPSSGDFGGRAVDIYALPDITVPVGAYILVGLGAVGDAGGGLSTDLEAPTLALDPSNGKIALARIATGLGCGGTTRCPATNVVDLVGYGSATDFEGSATGALSASSSASRKGGGCTDSNNNKADFDLGAPAPRNTGSRRTPCGGTGGGPPPADDAGGSSLPPIGGSSGSSGGSGSSGSSSGAGTNPAPDSGTADTSGCSAAGVGSSRDGYLGLAVGLLGLAVSRRRRRRV